MAQVNRASDFGSEGWGFDSLRGRHCLQQLRTKRCGSDCIVLPVCYQDGCSLFLSAPAPINRLHAPHNSRVHRAVSSDRKIRMQQIIEELASLMKKDA